MTWIRSDRLPLSKEKVFLIKNSKIEKKYHLKLRIVTLMDATKIVVERRSFSASLNLRKKERKNETDPTWGKSLVLPKLVVVLV